MEKPKNYAWDAKDYAQNSRNQLQWAKELIPKLNLNGNEMLLDIGCGDGKITAELAMHLLKGKAVGIDSSNQMIKLAQENFPPQDYPNLSFQVMDARVLSFKENFDIVFSNAALHWILDQKSVLQGVKKCLKPRGRLLFQMGGKGNAKDVLGILDDLLSIEPWQQFFENFAFPYAFCSAEEYCCFLIDAGLKPTRVELIPKVMVLNGAEELAGWIRTTWLPYTERLPVDLQDLFVCQIVERYLKTHASTSEGLVHLDMVRLEVEAQKI